MLAENTTGSRSPLLPVGGRTALHSGRGQPAGTTLLDVSALNRIIDYPARDLTITVEAGLRIEELTETLAKERQRLPIDIPQAHRATIGGAIASNTSGPGRYGYGTLRDYVIGISGVDGHGRIFSAGGRVVKNVAGYDLCKLLIGSHGTLAVITQVTLKLKPVAEKRSLVLVPVESIAQIERILELLNTSLTRPVVLDVLNPKAVSQVRKEVRLAASGSQWLCCIGYEGNVPETDWQIETVQQELLPLQTGTPLLISGEDADRVWQALTEYQTASDDPVSVQISVLPSQVSRVLDRASQLGLAIQAHAGNGVLIGHLPDRCSTPELASDLLQELSPLLQEHHGKLQILHCEEDWSAHLSRHCTPLPEAALHQQMKAAFDPANTLSPGWLKTAAQIETV